MTSRADGKNPFRPKRPNNSVSAAALVGSVLTALVFFIIGLLKDFSIVPVVFFSMVCGAIAWFVLKNFLSRRKY